MDAFFDSFISYCLLLLSDWEHLASNEQSKLVRIQENMSSDTDSTDSSCDDQPSTQLTPSLKEYSKGISELCSFLAGKTAVLL